MGEPLLGIKGLCKEFKSVVALEGIDLEVRAGETLGLVGESGCGKTSLARCALRLMEPSTGSVCFEGLDLARLSPKALRKRRREFQMIFQDSFASLDPRLTVGETLSEPYLAQGLGSRQERLQWVRELMESMALDPALVDEVPGRLSGGQQQRVGIARALALGPKLLIADEPVSALDPSVQAHILNLLADLQEKRGLTLILISHSLSVVRYLCSRVVVMRCGRIVEDAPVDQFFAGPKHPYSKALLESMPSMNFARQTAE